MSYGSHGGSSNFFDESVPLETSSLKSHQGGHQSYQQNVPQQYESYHESGGEQKSPSFKSMLKKQFAEGRFCSSFPLLFSSLKEIGLTFYTS
jgi:hypothetical protein